MIWGFRQMVLLSSFLAVASPSYAWGPSLDSKAKGLAHYIMAVCHDLNGESAQAISEYKKSIKFNALEPAPRLKLGAYYLRFDQISEAQVQLKAAARISPENPQVHYLLALIYSSGHKYDLAASEYEIILKNTAKDDPANTSALYLLGSIYADTNERSKAIALFRQVLKIEPQNSEALNSLGYMYAEDGVHLDEAIRMVRKAIEIDPANGAYYDSLGWALYRQGKYPESLMVLQKAKTFIQDEILDEHISVVYKALKK